MRNSILGKMSSENVSYTAREYADMHLIYGEVRLNARAASRLYSERYPNRRHPNYEVFIRTHNAIVEGRVPGSRKSSGRPSIVDDDTILNEVEDNPSVSTRMIELMTGISKSSAHRILKKHQYHPYHIQRVQHLLPRDYQARVEFCQQMLLKHTENPDFFNNILWTDESSCTQSGYINLHNLHSWNIENPHNIRQDRSQYRFTVNLWTGIYDGKIFGPTELPQSLNGTNYLNFLRNSVPLLLEDVPLEMRRSLWFQHDGCPAHYSRHVREYLNQTYPHRWIGRGGEISWPPRSPDLNPLDFFYWGFLKNEIYSNPIRDEAQLRDRIRISAAKIAERSLYGLKRSFLNRCRACISEGGGHFEHLL